VGNDNPVELLPTERQKVRIDYSIGKPEYVYIYGGELELDGVRAQRRNAREEDSLLRIYGLDWITDLAGIETVEDNTDGGKTAPVYNLNGQRMLQPVKGINIVGRRKILK
jgi:hypothetical protein